MKAQAIKFKWLISEYDVRSTENTRYPLMSVSQYLGVIPRSELKGDEGRAETTENYKTSKPGQIVLNRMSAASGALGLATTYGLVSPDYAVLQPSNFVEPKYLYYLMKSDWFTGQMVARLKGIGAGGESASVRTPRVNISDLGDIDVNLPPIEEQRRIADYLDEQCKTLDQLYSQHERVQANVLELTKSEREKLIRGGATGKRILPGWLGEINANWDTIRLGRIASFKSGVGFPDEYQGKSYGDFPFMKVADLGSTDSLGILKTAGNYVDKFDANLLGARVAPAGTIVFPKVGAALLNNRRAILGVPGIFDNNVMGLLFKEGNNRYWYHVLRSVDMGRIMNPGPVPSIGASQVSEIVFPFPPLEEQSQIASRLDEIDALEAKLLTKNDEAKTKIAEYKKSLISEAVLGQTLMDSRKRIN